MTIFAGKGIMRKTLCCTRKSVTFEVTKIIAEMYGIEFLNDFFYYDRFNYVYYGNIICLLYFIYNHHFIISHRIKFISFSIIIEKEVLLYFYILNII